MSDNLNGLPSGEHLQSLGEDLEDNITTNLKEIGCEGVEWIHLA
jgi:hypothetical protein